MTALETNRKNASARRQANLRLAKLHPEEYEAILHEEKHKCGLRHLHGSDNPETIKWWGEVDQ